MYHPIIENLISGSHETLTTVVFLLNLPLIFTVFNFAKYFIGSKSVNIYSTTVTTFLFYSIGSTLTYRNSSLISGLFYGLILIFILFISVIIIHQATYKFQIHYETKVSIILILILIMLFFVFVLFKKINDPLLLQIEPLNIALLLMLSQQIISIYSKKQFYNSLYMISGTVILAALGFSILIYDPIVEAILSNPWIVLIFIPINLGIGKFSGLRLSEYVRFYDLLEEEDESTKDTEE